MNQKRKLQTIHSTRKKNNASVLRHSTFLHPYGIKPFGNSFLDSDNGIKPSKISGLGQFAILGDELLLRCLESFHPNLLPILSQTSKAFYIFTYHDDLWKQLVIKEYNGNFQFKGNWRNTYKFLKCPNQFIPDVIIKTQGFYSDYLYTHWRCLSVPLDELCGVTTDNIDRRSNLSMKEFIEEYGIPNKPVILTDVVTKWPAMKKWNFDFFCNLKSIDVYQAEAVQINFENYYQYMMNCNEESPLYLFDKSCTFGELKSDFTVPEYFDLDLFAVLGKDRPDYRWLIIGPQRSGSTFHVDPNSTSAWNACITGRKKWIMFPPNQIPPGVFPSADGSEVTSPVSLTEWFMNYYQETQNLPPELRPIEAVCNPGEIIFVPNQWWHCVMNLEPDTFTNCVDKSAKKSNWELMTENQTTSLFTFDFAKDVEDNVDQELSLEE
ncbi:hypothetical protein HDV02_000097 [Globomyces sp. JEL0801]|nr:hypothetical protein HDV02_000097 [Globomyces sp. JEL0801]